MTTTTTTTTCRLLLSVHQDKSRNMKSSSAEWKYFTQRSHPRIVSTSELVRSPNAYISAGLFSLRFSTTNGANLFIAPQLTDNTQQCPGSPGSPAWENWCNGWVERDCVATPGQVSLLPSYRGWCLSGFTELWLWGNTGSVIVYNNFSHPMGCCLLCLPQYSITLSQYYTYYDHILP